MLKPQLLQGALSTALRRLGSAHAPKFELPGAPGTSFRSSSWQLPSVLSLSQWPPLRFRTFSTVREILANGDIPFKRVRVVDNQGLVGDFWLGEARAIAQQRRTDLVVLSGEVVPPLCRLVDLATYIEELEGKAAAEEEKKQERKLREFSFDPGMRVKGLRLTAMIDEHDLERKVNQMRAFLEKGHRVELRVLQSRAKPEDVLDVALRVIAEVRDIAKPEFFEESVREYQAAVKAPKSLKRADMAPLDEMRVRLWPCSREQASTFKLPAHIIGPRRRKGPNIVGLDENIPEDAWKENRKPRDRLKDFRPSNLARDSAEVWAKDE